MTCGGGIRERNVSCVRFENEYLDMNDKPQINVTVVNDTECDQDDRPPETTDCNEFPCFFQWRVGEFGDVSHGVRAYTICGKQMCMYIGQ